MDKISNHRELAINFIVPYLREFEGVQNLAAVNGDRWQTVEDAIWYILNQMNLEIAEESWLDLIGEKVGKSREVLADPGNLFEFVDTVAESLASSTTESNLHGFTTSVGGTDGGLLLGGLTPDGSITRLDDDVYRRYIKSAIVRNNHDGLRATIISAVKELTGASSVKIIKTGTLSCDLIVYAYIDPQFITSIHENIRDVFPQCINVEHIYSQDFDGSFNSAVLQMVDDNVEDPSNVVGLYNFGDTTSGTTVPDLSPAGNDIVLSTDASSLEPDGSTLNFTGGQYFTIPDNDDMSFGDGATDSAFSIVSTMNFNDVTSSRILAKRTQPSDEEWEFRFANDDTLVANFYDDSVGGYIGRYYSVDLTEDEGSTHTYSATYDGSSSDSGINLYRDINRVDDSNFSSGSYTAMENLTSDVGNYLTNTSSIKTDIADAKYKILTVVREEIPQENIAKLSNLFKNL